MATEFIKIPVKKVNNQPWGQLSFFGKRHAFCGEKIHLQDPNFSFAGGHRVRLYVANGNVHWRIPEGVQLDIKQVESANPPRRRLLKR
jgi:hypothetical protein